MAVDPRLGYDPTLINANGTQTREQWIANEALSLTSEFGMADGTITTSPLLSLSMWTKAGIQPPPSNLAGIVAKNYQNVLPSSVYSSMYQMAAWAYDHPDQAGVSVPSGLPSGGPLLSDTDKQNIYGATQNAANNQNAIDLANIQESGANTRDAADNAERAQEAATQAAVDRESIASNERIAAANRTSTESIASADRAEQGREFDLGQAEDRRQFNATALTNLLQIGVQLAAAPTDWIANQYFLQNLSIPLTALNLGAAASVFGAVPPSGPSAAGPVAGGPAAMDGDTALAQAAGVQPGFVSVQQAIQLNPGNGSPSAGQSYPLTAAQTYPKMVQQAGGAEQLEKAVMQGRATEVAQAVQPNPVVNAAVQQAQQTLSQAPQFGARPQPAAVSYGLTPAPAEGVASRLRHGAFGTTTPIAQPRDPQPTAAQGTSPLEPQQPQQSVTSGGNTGQGNSGIYTGPQQTSEAIMTPTGGTQITPTSGPNASAPQGTAILQALSGQLGIPVDQLQQLVPANLLAGGYSVSQIAQTPVIQALQNQNSALNAFRTAPVGDSKFGTIQAFGIPLGIRGGQDVNAQTFLQANPSTQGQIQGALTATGQYFPDVQKQMLRSSPVTNNDVGAFGRRVFS